jgi:hypothetical protein
MTTTLRRPLRWALLSAGALALLALPTLHAQHSAAPSDEIYYTSCGAGALIDCGYENKTECNWQVDAGIDPVTRRFYFSINKGDCSNHGETRLYKDVPRRDGPDAQNGYAGSLPPKDPCRNLSTLAGMSPGNPCIGRTP